MAHLSPPPLPILGPYTPQELERKCSLMSVELLANWIWVTKRAIHANYLKINANERNEGWQLTPIPEEFLGLAMPPFLEVEEHVPYCPPPTRAYRQDGTRARENWNWARENETYLQYLKGKPAEPPIPPHFEGLRAWKGMEEILLDKMKAEALARRSPAVLARWRWRKENVA